MNDLLKLLPIYGLSLIAQLWFNYFNFKFLLAKIKLEDYTVPFVNHVFKQLWTFTLAAWAFNALVCYVPATIAVAYCYKIAIQNFGGLSAAVIVGLITSLITSLLFMRLMAGETLNKNGWIAIILILLALPFAANSSTNIK